MDDQTVKLEIVLADIPFIKRAILERTEDLLEYIETVARIKIDEIQEEIQDIEMDEFRADLREMIEKHKPTRRVGRPKGSKNKEKTNAK